MQPTEEDLLWASEQLSGLESLDGYPRTERAMNAVAGAYLRIVKDQPEVEWEINERKKGHRAAVSRQESSDQLISELVCSCDRFPAPVRMREIYERLGYSCADGKSVGDLLPEPRSY